MQIRSENERYEGFEGRLRFVGFVIVLLLALLGARLWQLQISRWAEFRGKSESNRLRIQRIEAPRGIILGRDGDEDGVVLADNRPARDLMFVAADCDIDPSEVCQRLEDLTGIDTGNLLENIDRAITERQPYRQIVIRRDVARAVLAQVEEHSYALPGVFTVVRPQRRYRHGRVGGQIIGYLGEITREELKDLKPAYTMGDLKGRTGLEGLYEDLLRGTDGQTLVTKFSRGRPQIRTDAVGNVYIERDDYGHSLIEEEIQKPESGEALRITLDIGLQREAERILEGEIGAAVVLDAETGQVLALASSPGYDPSVFVTRGMDRERIELLNGKPNRMINRSFQEAYAPGSVFKILMAAAALEEGVIDEHSSYRCTGSFRLAPGVRPFGCWKPGGHGDIRVVDALAFSCDVFFYNVGTELGVDRIHAWADRVGFGQKTGIDLQNEIAGVNPSREWWVEKLKQRLPGKPWNQRWFPGDTLNLSIGQGMLTATPLQTAVLAAFVVNGGYRIRPHLRHAEGPERSERLFSESTIALLREGMRKCVEKGPPAPTGTGHEADIEGIKVIGKTGSSQVVALRHQEKYETEEDIPKEIRDHAWFVAGVMDRRPAIAVCLLIEHGHHGSSVAAPLAKRLIEYFYTHCSAPEEMVLAGRGGETP